MKAKDVFLCAVDALLTVIWWWFWYGILTLILGDGWGFLLVLGIVFAAKIYERDKKAKLNERTA